MKISTSELKGRQLDYAVAIFEGFFTDCPNEAPKYSEYWEYCGELITKYEIYLSNEDGRWFASMPPHMNGFIQQGETPQIAICRAVVINFLGDEIDIPDELVGDDE
ncbi:MAG: phage protein NinX family protein [Candidatus Arsenophonus phytopathogenicus]